MLAFVEVTETEKSITIDGYTSYKTEKNIIKDVASVVAKYDEAEANALLDTIKFGLDKYNSPFIKMNNDGYFFEYEEACCASKYNEETDEVEYKDGFHNYFIIKIMK